MSHYTPTPVQTAEDIERARMSIAVTLRYEHEDLNLGNKRVEHQDVSVVIPRRYSFPVPNSTLIETYIIESSTSEQGAFGTTFECTKEGNTNQEKYFMKIQRYSKGPFQELNQCIPQFDWPQLFKSKLHLGMIPTVVDVDEDGLLDYQKKERQRCIREADFHRGLSAKNKPFFPIYQTESEFLWPFYTSHRNAITKFAEPVYIIITNLCEQGSLNSAIKNHLLWMDINVTDLDFSPNLRDSLANQVLIPNSFNSGLSRVPPTELSILDRISCLVTMIEALTILHGEDQPHKDIKAANIVRHSSQWILTDFGISDGSWIDETRYPDIAHLRSTVSSPALATPSTSGTISLDSSTASISSVMTSLDSSAVASSSSIPCRTSHGGVHKDLHALSVLIYQIFTNTTDEMWQKELESYEANKYIFWTVRWEALQCSITNPALQSFVKIVWNKAQEGCSALEISKLKEFHTWKFVCNGTKPNQADDVSFEALMAFLADPPRETLIYHKVLEALMWTLNNSKEDRGKELAKLLMEPKNWNKFSDVITNKKLLQQKSVLLKQTVMIVQWCLKYVEQTFDYMALRRLQATIIGAGNINDIIQSSTQHDYQNHFYKLLLLLLLDNPVLRSLVLLTPKTDTDVSDISNFYHIIQAIYQTRAFDTDFHYYLILSFFAIGKSVNTLFRNNPEWDRVLQSDSMKFFLAFFKDLLTNMRKTKELVTFYRLLVMFGTKHTLPSKITWHPAFQMFDMHSLNDSCTQISSFIKNPNLFVTIEANASPGITWTNITDESYWTEFAQPLQAAFGPLAQCGRSQKFWKNSSHSLCLSASHTQDAPVCSPRTWCMKVSARPICNHAADQWLPRHPSEESISTPSEDIDICLVCAEKLLKICPVCGASNLSHSIAANHHCKQSYYPKFIQDTSLPIPNHLIMHPAHMTVHHEESTFRSKEKLVCIFGTKQLQQTSSSVITPSSSLPVTPTRSYSPPSNNGTLRFFVEFQVHRLKSQATTIVGFIHRRTNHLVNSTTDSDLSHWNYAIGMNINFDFIGYSLKDGNLLYSEQSAGGNMKLQARPYGKPVTITERIGMGLACDERGMAQLFFIVEDLVLPIVRYPEATFLQWIWKSISNNDDNSQFPASRSSLDGESQSSGASVHPLLIMDPSCSVSVSPWTKSFAYQQFKDFYSRPEVPAPPATSSNHKYD